MDLHKVLNDIRQRAIGLKLGTQEEQNGYFVSFRQIGLPIREEDYENPAEPFFDSDDLIEDEPMDYPDDIDTSDGLNPSDVKDKVKKTEDMNYLRTFVLSDNKIKIDNDFSVEPSTQKVHQTWDAIVNGATIDLDLDQLDDEQEQKFKEIDERITDEMKKKVSDAQKEVDRALETLVEKYTDYFFEGKMKAWRNIGRIYQKKVDKARQKYKRIARRYEQYESVLNSNGIDPTTLLISRAKNQFEAWQIQLGGMATIPYTFMTPSDWYDPDSSGWNRYSEENYNKKSTVKSSNKSFSASSGFNFAIWKPKGNGGYDKSKNISNIRTENMKIEFSYCIAKVERPWLDTSLLKAKNWYLKSSNSENKFEQNCISDGTFEQDFANKPNIFFPSLITSLILIKDVKVTWEEEEVGTEEISKAIKAGASVGWGPIKLFDGKYEKDNRTSMEEFDVNSKELSSDGVQLIGYTSIILPPSPFMASI